MGSRTLEQTRVANRNSFSGNQSGASGWPLWKWLHIGSLDAPLIACLWSTLVARTFAVQIPEPTELVLFIVVWSIYLLDRALDARASVPLAVFVPSRRLFYRKHARIALWLALCLSTAAACLALLMLPVRVREAGMALAAVVITYVLVVQGLPELLWPKELAVGALFTAGVFVPMAASPQAAGRWLPACVPLLMLCWANCSLIEIWEQQAAVSRSTAFIGRNVVPLTVTLAVSVYLAAALNLIPAPLAFAQVASAIAVIFLDQKRNEISVEARRVLIDAALCTPAVVLLLC